MKLLIVEDEAKLAAYLQKGLAEEGFVVDVAGNGIDGLHLAFETDYDLLILDRMLPAMDGLSLLAKLRETKRTPVLVLSARVRMEERVEGLTAGADDYLTKPFAFSELIARVNALIRRARPADVSAGALQLRLRDLELDLLRRSAMRAGKRLDLTGKEFQLLEFFLRRTGEVVSRSDIAERVWDSSFGGDTNVIDVTVRRLRSKVDVGFDAPLLHTVRGAGYILEDRDR